VANSRSVSGLRKSAGIFGHEISAAADPAGTQTDHHPDRDPAGVSGTGMSGEPYFTATDQRLMRASRNSGGCMGIGEPDARGIIDRVIAYQPWARDGELMAQARTWMLSAVRGGCSAAIRVCQRA